MDTRILLILHAIFGKLIHYFILGRVAEWPNASVSKTDLLVRVTGVRIPPLPIRIEVRLARLPDESIKHTNQKFRRRLWSVCALAQLYSKDQ